MVMIANLTQKQVELCDKLWACDDMEDVETFITSLPSNEDRREARVLLTMMVVAICDEEVQTYDDCYTARNILDRVSGY